jgi:hypothetical protein
MYHYGCSLCTRCHLTDIVLNTGFDVLSPSSMNAKKLEMKLSSYRMSVIIKDPDYFGNTTFLKYLPAFMYACIFFISSECKSCFAINIRRSNNKS